MIRTFIFYYHLKGKWKCSGRPGLFNFIYSGLLYSASIKCISHNIYLIYDKQPCGLTNALFYSLHLCLSYSCHKGELQDKKVSITDIGVCLYFWRLKWIKDNMNIITLVTAERNKISFVLKNSIYGGSLQLLINDLNMKISNTGIKSVQFSLFLWKDLLQHIFQIAYYTQVCHLRSSH